MEVRAVSREPPMKDSLATTGPSRHGRARAQPRGRGLRSPSGPPPTPTARRLVEASISPNTWADVAYAGDGDGI